MNRSSWLKAFGVGAAALLFLICQPCFCNDDSNSAQGDKQSSSEKKDDGKPLQGGVSANKTTLDAQTGVSDSGQPLQSKIDQNWFNPEAILNKTNLSAEDYRKVNFGITGFQVTKRVDRLTGQIVDRFPIVTAVYAGCPAEKAGIEVGDKVIQANDHMFKINELQAEFWRILDGPAGSTVNITVVRNGEPMTFKLTRMNFEDLPDRRLRKEYERLIQILGAPMQ